MHVVRYTTWLGESYLIGSSVDVHRRIAERPSEVSVLREVDARAVVRAWARSASPASLEELASTLGMSPASSRDIDGRQILAFLLSRVGWNLSVAVRRKRVVTTLAPATVASAEEYVPEASTERSRTWIEIEMVDSTGQPIPNATYEIRAPDGAVTRGRTGRDGVARVENLVAGACSISFPELDADAWAAA